MKKVVNYVKDLIEEFQKDNIPLLGAAQAYYYLLSIVPMLILLLSILPYLNISAEAAMNTVTNFLPEDTAEVFRENIINVVDKPNGGLLTVGILGTLWSASSGINAFIKSANEAYDVEETRSFIKVRLLSIILTLGMIIGFVVALALPVFGDVIIGAIDRTLNLPDQTVIFFQVLRWAIGIVVMSAILMALYHFAPNKNIPFKHVLPGAIITSILWQVISLAFSFYVSNFGNYTATYGSLGGVIILMLWFFLTGIILMVGAEINVIYHRKHGGGASKAA
ncbi:YihY/virulence factor BrkB family protein [Halobacillus yeomjeoni]|uniref:YihY/virulence factor BrkB family protein n=1 Tax=Halobacillus yeomjeoni TaxID=311194 RepID=A0A931MV88_9BACI|nr:YihY/virulence factor BrkB family protein [Halobacillus yeomjeoni]MBH0230325.1 YihY/virulence factor BrkB family protein [Halobacillus yeomjeoni]MCA0984812.1 YihY/virulence factor BrkB family protein [Halobacillus yeomjeoni]